MNEASQTRYGRIQAEHLRSRLLLVALKWNRTPDVDAGIRRLGSGRRSSLLRSSFLALLLVLCAQVFTPSHASAQTGAAQLRAETIFPGKSWQTVASLEKAGWSKEKLAAAHVYADSIHSSAVMIVQGGQIVDEWGDIDAKIDSYSVRKSFISSLYGIYSAEGAIDVNETLEHLGIDEPRDPLTQAEKQARVVDLLRARSGVYHDVDFETSYMKAHRPPRGSHAPGTFWYYNNWDYNVLGAIFEKKTGLKIGDAFYRRIAQPLGMEDFQRADLFYFGGPLSNYPAYHFESSARDMARFGLLYLHHGRWNGKQIVPEAWVEKSTHGVEMLKDEHFGEGDYEYLWWVEYGGGLLYDGALPGEFFAMGANGHFILVIPTLDLVIVNRTDSDPPARDAKTIFEWTSKVALGRKEFGHLVKLILDARTGQ